MERSINIFAKNHHLEAVRSLVDRGVTFTRWAFGLSMFDVMIEKIVPFCNLLGISLGDSFDTVMGSVSDDELALEYMVMYREQLRDKQVYQLAIDCNLYHHSSHLTNLCLKLGELYQKFGRTVSYDKVFYSAYDNLHEDRNVIGHINRVCYLIETFRGKGVPAVDNFFYTYPGVIQTVYNKIHNGTLTDYEKMVFNKELKMIFS